MTERSIVEAAARLRRLGEPFLVATVVAADSSAYRRPGARMILTRFRWIAGSVSGGCLEGDLSEKGWLETRHGGPVLLTYDATQPGIAQDDVVRSAFGLGCDGVVEVLLERAGEPGRIDALAIADRCLRAQTRGAIATVFRTDVDGVRIGTRFVLQAGGTVEDDADVSDEPGIDAPGIDASLRRQIATDLHGVIESGMTANRTYETDAGTLDVLLEAVLPPPRLFLCGTGHDAVPIAAMARSIGWSVVVCTTQTGFATRERFSVAADEVLVGGPTELAARITESDRAVAIVMNHDLERDRESLDMLLASSLAYIGVLGPRARTQRLLGELGLDDEDPRVHAPIGIEIGAHTPQELALSILAELQAILGTPAARPRVTREVVEPDAPTRERQSSGAGSAAVLAVAAPAS